MKLLAICIMVALTAAFALAVALALRRLTPRLAERWRWAAWVGDWLWERGQQ